MEPLLVHAAEYMRVSTEHQQYSIANQAAAIQAYANAHSMEIVRTYVDRAKSGLSIASRHGLKELINTVESGAADFSVLLVYDVSRWGRFQDVDESAFYEYSLKRAGVPVIYCAESFRDGGTPLDALLKTLKRTMAAEYSRELSVRVSEGMRRVAASGYRVGSPAGFGLRRLVFDPSGSRRVVLENGERKCVQTDRVTLIHGPLEEVQVVRKVFDLFIREELSEARIASYLAERGITTRYGRRWSKKTIRDMLTNPKYVGDLAFGRTTSRLLSPLVNTPPDKWVVVRDRFEPIVSRETFAEVKAVYKRRAEKSDPEVMLAQLRSLLAKHGRLSGPLIDAEKGMLQAQTYHRRFGSLNEAFRRVGWGGEVVIRRARWRPQIRALQKELEQAVEEKLSEVADSFCRDAKSPRWRANGGVSISATAVRSLKVGKTRRVWTLYPGKRSDADLVVLARIGYDVEGIIDYFVFRGGLTAPIRVFENNPARIEMHRFPDLSFLETACQLSAVEDL